MKKSPQPAPSTNRNPFIAAGLVCLTIVVFSRVWNFGYILIDDPFYIENNPYVINGLSLQSMGWAFTTGYMANWHPLTWISHMVDVELFGFSPRGPHIINVLFHAAGAVLLFLALTRMTRAVWPSAFVAAVFALHPLRVESVAWIAERKDVLSTFFWMLTMWAYVLYTEKPNWKRYAFVPASFALGLMAKPMLVTLPFVLLLLDYWPLRRLSLERDAFYESAKKCVLEKLPLFALTVASSIVTYLVQARGGAIADAVSFPWRVANAVVAYAMYVKLHFLPTGLAMPYPHPGTTLSMAVIGVSVVVLAVITAFVLYKHRDLPALPVGWLWFLGTAVPVIGLVQVGSQAMADRYTYIPLIGITMMVAYALPDLVRRTELIARLLPAAAVLAVVVLSLCTWIQLSYWRSDLDLFARAVRVTENNAVAHNQLGLALAKAGREREAQEHYLRAVEINPLHYRAMVNLGESYIHTGRARDAIPVLNRAIEVADRPHANAHLSLGNAYFHVGDPNRALEQFGKAIDIDGNSAAAQNGYGTVLAATGNLEGAIVHFREALRLNPNHLNARKNLERAQGLLASRGN